MSRPLYLQFGFISLVVTLFIVSFLTDVQTKRLVTTYPDLTLTTTFFQFLSAIMTGSLLLIIFHGRIQRLPTTWWGCLPLLPITLSQTLGGITTTQSFGAMAVSFTHTIKASEPIFTAAIARLVMGERFTLSLYLSLLPIIGGVIMVSLTELSFSWFGLVAALVSNACFASRAVFIGKQVNLQKLRVLELEQRKKDAAALASTSSSKSNELISNVPSSSPSSDDLRLDPRELHLDDINTFLYVCTFSAILMLPLWVYFESNTFVRIVMDEYQSGSFSLLIRLILSGIGQYTYVLCSLIILSRTSPITHVVMHSLRRVYVIFLSIYLRDGNFMNVTLQNVIGTMCVVLGAGWFAREKGRQKRIVVPTTTKNVKKE